MKNKLKLIGKVTLCLLMFAVAARPVVVEASTIVTSPASPSLVTLQTHSFQAKSTVFTLRFKRQSNHEFSKLKFLPKNTVGLYQLETQVAKHNFSQGIGRSAVICAVVPSKPSQNFLVLRI